MGDYYGLVMFVIWVLCDTGGETMEELTVKMMAAGLWQRGWFGIW
jgi:hypothetical protein